MIAWKRCYQCGGEIDTKGEAYHFMTTGLGIIHYRCVTCEEHCLKSHGLYAEAKALHAEHCNGCGFCEGSL